jgi:DNA-binding transcriptional ArsR family regulator
MGRHGELSHEARRAIVFLLRDQELASSEIASRLGRKRPAVSHHLTLLLQAGVLRVRPVGSTRYYSIDAERTLDAWNPDLLTWTSATQESRGLGRT